MKEREGMSNEPSSFLDPLSLVVIVLTLVLFVIALFVQRIQSRTIAGVWSVSGFGEADHDEPQERCVGAARGRATGEDPESAAKQARWRLVRTSFCE
jgi:hypothetical protein